MDELPAAGDEASEARPDSLATPQDEKPGLLAFVRRRWKAVLLLLAVIAALATLAVRRSSQDATNAARLAAQKATSTPIISFSRPSIPIRSARSPCGRAKTIVSNRESSPDTGRRRLSRCARISTIFAATWRPKWLAPWVTAWISTGRRFACVRRARRYLPKCKRSCSTSRYTHHCKVRSRMSRRDYCRRGDAICGTAREFLTLVPAEQFFLVVLAQQVEDYRYLHTLDSIWAPRGYSDERGLQAHYRVLLPKITAAAPLPDQALFWTNTAVVLWDGLDPKLLSTSQQQAMLDWLHWGGQLIVSGPDSLDLLRGSFLEDVLAAGPGPSWEMNEDTLASLARASRQTRPRSCGSPSLGRASIYR